MTYDPTELLKAHKRPSNRPVWLSTSSSPAQKMNFQVNVTRVGKRWVNFLGVTLFVMFVYLRTTKSTAHVVVELDDELRNRHVSHEGPRPVFVPVGFEGIDITNATTPKKITRFFSNFAVGVRAFRGKKKGNDSSKVWEIENSIMGAELTWLQHFGHVMYLGNHENRAHVHGGKVEAVFDEEKDDYVDVFGDGGIPPWISRKDEAGHVFLVGLRALWRRYPYADWYMVVNGDTYVFAENLMDFKPLADPSKPMYIGSAHVFRGCGGIKEFGQGPKYAGGVAPIILSRAAVQLLMESGKLGSCVADYTDCYGDVRVALCLSSLGLKLTGSEDFQRSSIPHIDNDPVWHPAYTAPPCGRPLSSPGQTMQSMLSLAMAEQMTRRVGKTMTYATLRTFQLAANPKKFEQVTWADKDFTRDGPEYLSLQVRLGTGVDGGTGVVDCARMCEVDARCKSWRIEPDRMCYLMDTVGKKVGKKGYYCGEPYVCRNA